MNKQDFFYTNLPQYIFKNIFLYILLSKLLQFIKPLGFCLNKIEIFLKLTCHQMDSLLFSLFFLNRVGHLSAYFRVKNIDPHCCPFLYHQSQELNKEKIFYIYTNILFCLKICFTNHCITLLKRIFFKYFFVRIRTPIIDPSWPQNIMVWTHLKSTRYKKFHSKFVLYQLHSSREKHFFGEKKFHHISFIFVLLSL